MKTISTQTVMTAGVAAAVEHNAKMLQSVMNGLGKFRNLDWGLSLDKQLNDSEPMSAMGVYPAPCSEGKIWIKSDLYEDEGTRVLTVLFPSEY